MYPQRQREGRKSLKGHVEMTVGFDLPPVLALVPASIIRGVGETVGASMNSSPHLQPALAEKPFTGLTGILSFVVNDAQVLRQMAEQMKQDMDTGLAADFNKYRREKLTERRSSP
jgi:hypothetical protein